MKKYLIVISAILFFALQFNLNATTTTTKDVMGYPATIIVSDQGVEHDCGKDMSLLCMRIVLIMSHSQILEIGSNISMFFYESIATGWGYKDVRLIEEYDTTSEDIPIFEVMPYSTTYTNYIDWENAVQ